MVAAPERYAVQLNRQARRAEAGLVQLVGVQLLCGGHRQCHGFSSDRQCRIRMVQYALPPDPIRSKKAFAAKRRKRGFSLADREPPVTGPPRPEDHRPTDRRTVITVSRNGPTTTDVFNLGRESKER